jgi:hypothetical protein
MADSTGFPTVQGSFFSGYVTLPIVKSPPERGLINHYLPEENRLGIHQQPATSNQRFEIRAL